MNKVIRYEFEGWIIVQGDFGWHVRTWDYQDGEETVYLASSQAKAEAWVLNK